MAAAVSHRLAASVAAHAWNADGTMLAISPNTSEIWIYTNCNEAATSKWEKKYVLDNVS
jgi:actin related protein 2/3 complex subunit 1A/1B